MNSLFLIAAFNAFFFAALRIQKKPGALHDRILFSWLVYLGLFTGIYALFSESLFTGYPVLSASFISLLLLHGPFLYLYVSSLVKKTKQRTLRKLIHFAPFLIFNLYFILLSFHAGAAEHIRLDHSDRDQSTPWFFQVFLVLTVLSGPFYFIKSSRLFKELDINIRNNFSYAEGINLGWLRKLVYMFGLVWTLLMIMSTLHHVFHMFSWVFCTQGITLSLSIFIILIGYFGLKQREIFSFPEKAMVVSQEKQEKYAGSALKEEDAKQYAERLLSHMGSQKPYLDPDLTLAGLADALDIPSHYLSQIINERIGSNFFDFINQHRVEEIKRRIADPSYAHYSLLGIAFESGFNSKSAFNRVFKKLTGRTPSEFKREQEV